MFSIRNMGGVALFLFGTTYLWLTSLFAGKGGGLTWAIVNVSCLVVMLGFAIATWGLFEKTTWWETVAIGSALLGFAPIIAYLVAAHGQVPGYLFNDAIHVLGNVGVLVLLMAPSLEHWVAEHVAAGH